MRIDEQRGGGSASALPGPLARLLAYAITAVALVAAFMFSLLAVAVVVAAGLIGWGYLWWKTRHLRRAMRAAPPDWSGPSERGGRVIEGEVVRDEHAERLRDEGERPRP